jgi:fatty-acyl-CoA synthase
MTFWNSINTAMSLVINSNTHTVNVMPPFHTGGWNVLLAPILHHGGYVCMVKKFDPYLVNELMSSESVTVFMGVPTMLHMMAQQENFTHSNFDTLLYIIVGGEPMPIPLIEQYDVLGVAIRQGYGMTEVGPNLTSLPEQDAIRKKGSIGWPNFYVDIRVVKDDGTDANIDETGELWLKGPMVMPAYWNNKELTEMAFSPDGQWFKSGDLVRRDDEGYIFVVDRLKNMYISGGENVYPAEIERVINTIEDVSESVVIGVKDAKWGEVGKAIIVWKPGANIPSDERIRDNIATQLAKFKIPKYFMSLEELPKNDAGKLDRAKLKKLYS